MTVEIFLSLLSAFTVATGLVVEIIKKIITDKAQVSYNYIAIISGLVIGTIGTFVFYALNSMAFTTITFIYAICMGIAAGLSSMLGYDKIAQLVTQLAK